MIVLRPGRWASRSGRWFIVERVYKDGIMWTPICVKRFRYTGGRCWK